MSWDSYCTTTLEYCAGHADQVAVLGLADGKVWATNGLNISNEEGAVIAKAIADDDKAVAAFASNGIHVGGVKFNFLRNIDNSFVGKRKDNGSITVQKTKQTIVIAHTKEGSQVGTTNTGLSRICNYLETSNY